MTLRAEHKHVGDVEKLCSRCNLPFSQHRAPRERAPQVVTKNRVREYRPRPPRKRKPTEVHKPLFLGIDGEGQGREDHKYVMMAACDDTGKRRWYIENFDGLETEQIFEWLLSIPAYARIFSYSFNYDLTKILGGLDDARLFYLNRPDYRRRPKDEVRGPFSIKWVSPKGVEFHVNLVMTKFTIKKVWWEPAPWQIVGKPIKYVRRERIRTIWDIWKFYQSKFVSALRDWKVPTAESRDLWDRMQRMKDQRADFDKLTREEVREYCFEECMCMALLARKLIKAHQDAELNLTSFYGAGSSASAMLKRMEIKEKIRPPPKEMMAAVAAAFFGGRFENSCLGEILKVIDSKDISSAYPYQLCFLPCLVHGSWTLTKDRKRLEKRSAALVHYGFNSGIKLDPDEPWAPFPFRDSEGSICYPQISGGGWVWMDEFLQGERLFFPRVRFREAWVYEKACDCKPFEQLPQYYLQRLAIGKEGPGIVLKLGMNSCYGKLAQSLGNPIFNSWIWAGMITSGCRAQILELMGMHYDRRNMLMVATDGIYTTEKIGAPKPKNTGTDVTVFDRAEKKNVRKPLGGWETATIDKGVFIAQPGVYFPLSPTDKEIKSVRGRGVGKNSVFQNWRKIVESYREHGPSQSVMIANVSRFCGMKSSIWRTKDKKTKEWVYHRAKGNHLAGEPSYGQWITRPVELVFNALPKRRCILPNGQMPLVQMPTDVESVPYDNAVRSIEAQILEAVTLELLEQPDIDLADYELFAHEE